VVLVATIVGFVSLLGPDFIHSFADLLFGRSSGLLPAFGILGFLSASSINAAWRILPGVRTWLRHLAATDREQRRAVTLALVAAQVPYLFLLSCLAALELTSSSAGNRVSAVKWAALPVLAWGAALLALPVRRRLLVGVLVLLAAPLAALGSWWTLLAGAVALLAADNLAGSFSKIPAPRPRRHATRGLPFWITIRATGWRLPAALLVAFLPWLAATAFVHNNRLPAHDRLRAAILGGAVSCVVLAAQFANLLAKRRPTWHWSRSLPWSARQRVLWDALWLTAMAGSILALTGWTDSRAVAPLLAGLPCLALRAAAATRARSAGGRSPATQVLTEGLPAAALLALQPLSAVAFFVAAPFVLDWAAERDRGEKLGAWRPLVSGDPQGERTS
jgi:hypothetical protein